MHLRAELLERTRVRQRHEDAEEKEGFHAVGEINEYKG